MEHASMPLADIVDPRHTAVLVVDVETYFTNLTMVPPAAEMLPRLRRFLDIARDVGALRIFIRTEITDARWPEPWRQQFSEVLRDANAPGSPGNAFTEGFEPEPGDLIVIKDRFSAFMGTELKTLLRDRGVRTVIVAGLYTDICVSSTARDAFQLDFFTVTLSDCTAAGNLERHEASLATSAIVFGRVCRADEVVLAWQAHAAAAGAHHQRRES